jgi:hypothetical protein
MPKNIREDDDAAARSFDLYVVACRAVAPAEDKVRLETWQERLAVGAALPTMPLWISTDYVLPVDLEAAYAATCDSLRIGG